MLTFFNYLYQTHEVALFVLLSLFFMSVSICALFVVRRFVPLKLRYIENPVLGNMSALISIIFGVLAGLIALYLINNISETGTAVQREANAIANLYRDSRWLKEPMRTSIQNDLKAYIERVVHVEWPRMQRGEAITHNGDINIDSISEHLRLHPLNNQADILIVKDMLEEIKSLYNSREHRIASGDSALNPEIWIVIIIGTILTISINYLFGMHFYLHVITVCAATLMCSSMLFLLYSLSRPFEGEYVIEADAFKPVHEFILGTTNPP